LFFSPFSVSILTNPLPEMSEDGAEEKRMKVDESEKEKLPKETLSKGRTEPMLVSAVDGEKITPDEFMAKVIEKLAEAPMDDDEFNCMLEKLRARLEAAKRPKPDGTPATQVIMEEPKAPEPEPAKE
jgi:hypothetical protein